MPRCRGLAGCRIATHVGHVADDRDVVDLAVLEPLLQTRAREAAGQVLVDQQIAVAESATSLRNSNVGLSFWNDPSPGSPTCRTTTIGTPACDALVHRFADPHQTLVTRRILDRQRAGEVLLLHIDHDQRRLSWPHSFHAVAAQQ